MHWLWTRFDFFLLFYGRHVDSIISHCSFLTDRLIWLDPKNNEVVNDSNLRVYTVLKKNTLKLELKSPTKEDSGIYKCVARNEVYYLPLFHHFTNLFVLVPVWLEKPRDLFCKVPTLRFQSNRSVWQYKLQTKWRRTNDNGLHCYIW